MGKLEKLQWHEGEPSPLGEVDERAALAGEGLPHPQAENRPSFDGALVAISVGLALWFMCAVMVISTFVHPGAPRVPAVNPHGGHSLLLTVQR